MPRPSLVLEFLVSNPVPMTTAEVAAGVNITVYKAHKRLFKLFEEGRVRQVNSPQTIRDEIWTLTEGCGYEQVEREKTESPTLQNLKAMQAMCLARLIAGLGPDWKQEEQCREEV